MTDKVFHQSHFLTSLFENTHIFAQIFSSETKIIHHIYISCWLPDYRSVMDKQVASTPQYLKMCGGGGGGGGGIIFIC